MVKSFDFLQNWQFRNSHKMVIFKGFLGLKGLYGASIKTRIETNIDSNRWVDGHKVYTVLPLKQGLKLHLSVILSQRLLSLYGASIKTRIETSIFYACLDD